jgi:integrase
MAKKKAANLRGSRGDSHPQDVCVRRTGDGRENKAVKVFDSHAPGAWAAIEGMACRVRLRFGQRLVFASRKLMGRKPRRGSMVVADHVKPAAVRAGVIEVKEGKTYLDGELVKRFGFHTFRHSLTSGLMANDENPQIVRAMLRGKNLNMLSHYTHSFKADKLRLRALCWKGLFGSRIGS